MPPGSKVVQIHPTLRCNLKCAHCYSTSGPHRRATLDLGTVERVLDDARALGYTSVSVSGGEPLFYDDIENLLDHARSIGLHTAMITNGALLTRERARHMAPLLDVVAVSLDGPPDLHNRIRGSRQAFDRAVRALDHLADVSVPSAVVHTVTRTSMPLLTDIADIVSDHGVEVLRLHPLEMYGRASTEMTDDALTAADRHRLYLQALALNHLSPRLTVQVDLLLRSQIVAEASADPGRGTGHPPADLPDTLVVGADGSVVPLAYGIHPRYAICNLHGSSLAESWPAFRHDTLPRLLELQEAVVRDVVEDHESMVVNWYERLVAGSWTRTEALRVDASGTTAE